MEIATQTTCVPCWAAASGTRWLGSKCNFGCKSLLMLQQLYISFFIWKKSVWIHLSHLLLIWEGEDQFSGSPVALWLLILLPISPRHYAQRLLHAGWQYIQNPKHIFLSCTAETPKISSILTTTRYDFKFHIPAVSTAKCPLLFNFSFVWVNQVWQFILTPFSAFSYQKKSPIRCMYLFFNVIGAPINQHYA